MRSPKTLVFEIPLSAVSDFIAAVEHHWLIRDAHGTSWVVGPVWWNRDRATAEITEVIFLSANDRAAAHA